MGTITQGGFTKVALLADSPAGRRRTRAAPAAPAARRPPPGGRAGSPGCRAGRGRAGAQRPAAR